MSEQKKELTADEHERASDYLALDLIKKIRDLGFRPPSSYEQVREFRADFEAMMSHLKVAVGRDPTEANTKTENRLYDAWDETERGLLQAVFDGDERDVDYKLGHFIVAVANMMDPCMEACE